jgi:hypothetical protein
VVKVRLLLVACLLAGVATAGCSPDEGGAAPTSSRASGSSADLEGVVLEVVHTASGDDHRLDATVRNTGLRIFYYLWVPRCGLGPWNDAMVGPEGEAVQPREPEVHCLPCGWDALSPGESLSRSFEWDERLWDFDEERSYDAPPGRYVWTVAFYAEPKDADVCGGRHAVGADVEVDVD